MNQNTKNRQHLHKLLDQACDRCQEGEFVATHFVAICLEEATETKIASKQQSNDTISDGFGSTWNKKCPMCKKNTIEIVRPGKVQCSNCG